MKGPPTLFFLLFIFLSFLFSSLFHLRWPQMSPRSSTPATIIRLSLNEALRSSHRATNKLRHFWSSIHRPLYTPRQTITFRSPTRTAPIKTPRPIKGALPSTDEAQSWASFLGVFGEPCATATRIRNFRWVGVRYADGEEGMNGLSLKKVVVKKKGG